MAMTKGPEYMGQDYPYDGVLVPPSLNENITITRRQFNADAATDIIIGGTCYLSQGTEKNDATATDAEYGADQRTEGSIWVAAAPAGRTYLAFPPTLTYPNVPWLAPNVSITAASYQLAAEAPFTAIKLRIGMYVWLRIGSDITADVTYDTYYYCASGGMPGASGDPDGQTVAENGHTFRAVAAFTNMNWALFEYRGVTGYDDTA